MRMLGFLAVVFTALSCLSCNQLMTVNSGELAKCMTGKGVRLYVGEGCPACDRQKSKFGDGVRHLKIIDCWDDENQPECRGVAIKMVPTWLRADGDRLVGVRELDELAEWSECGR